MNHELSVLLYVMLVGAAGVLAAYGINEVPGDKRVKNVVIAVIGAVTVAFMLHRVGVV